MQNGYSLIEIVIGLVIITIFLLCTGSLVNASFTNYRLVLQRNEALDLAIASMEEILQSDTVEPISTGYTNDSMEVKVDVEKVHDDQKEYDNVFLVTVNVEYTKTPTDKKKNNITLQSLKIVK